MRDIRIYILICVVLFTTSGKVLSGQPKAGGISLSFNNLGVSFEQYETDGNVSEFSLHARFPEVFLGIKDILGCDVSYTWNLKIGEIESSEGNKVCFFAGPGAIVGWGQDYKTASGVYLGMKGRIGAECSYTRHKVTISAYIAPVLGAHVRKTEDSVKMDYYKNGLIYALVPEIGIKYRF